MGAAFAFAATEKQSARICGPIVKTLQLAESSWRSTPAAFGGCGEHKTTHSPAQGSRGCTRIEVRVPRGYLMTTDHVAAVRLLEERTGAGQQECSDALERFDGDAALAEGYLAYVHAAAVARPQQGTNEVAARLSLARRRAERYGGGNDEQQR